MAQRPSQRQWYKRNRKAILKRCKKRYMDSAKWRAEKCKKSRLWRKNNPQKYKAQLARAHATYNPARAMFNNAKRRAKAKGLPFNLKPSDIVIPTVCPVLGIKLKIRTNKRIGASPTLDRIKNHRGYVRGNVCVISYRANRLKSDATVEELERVLSYARRMKNVAV